MNIKLIGISVNGEHVYINAVLGSEWSVNAGLGHARQGIRRVFCGGRLVFSFGKTSPRIVLYRYIWIVS